MLTFIYLFALLVIFSPKVNWFDHEASDVHTAVIDVTGVIADKESASADNIISSLQAAFHDKNTKGIILKINSPGGSPVQSGYVYDEIKRLRIKYPNIKVYAVISDLGASGAYYIASAADEIYADKASLVGSIGVTATSFGFVKLINMLGIERRVYTSGEHKAFLDPFQPQKEEETNFWQKALDSTHKQFIASVKKGRGDRLKDTDNPQIFSGLIWTGEQALKLGLIDGLGSSEYVAREKIGAKVLVDFTIEDSPFDRVAKKLGASVSDSIMMHLNNSSIPAFH
ncbi:UNVERIFIED_CONTAM: hypothetical protein GTU68_066248 [Idotea baltica]|nr:hypothetical protein [Idotea baltica]